MNTGKIGILTIAVVLLFAAGQGAYAHDFWDLWQDKPWQRGDPGSTYQLWEFTENPGPEPAAYSNPYGVPLLLIGNGTYPDWVPGPDQAVIPTWHLGSIEQGADGTITEMPGTVELSIPNKPIPNFHKLVYVQITSDKGVLANQPPVSIPAWTSVTSPGPIIKHPYGGWYTYNWLIEIRPNPDFEQITFTFPYSTNISQVVVDTICVPEPSALASLGTSGILMGLVALRRRVR